MMIYLIVSICHMQNWHSIVGNATRIGIVEFDEDWFPFQFDNMKNPYETEGTLSEDEVGEDDDDGVLDTWV